MRLEHLIKEPNFCCAIMLINKNYYLYCLLNKRGVIFYLLWMKEFYYLLKVKGLKGNSDYVQVRNQNFELLANLRLEAPFESFTRFFGEQTKVEKPVAFAQRADYGILTKLEL